MMPIIQILQISLILFLIAYFLFKINKLALNAVEKILIFTAPVLLTVLSLLISITKFGGTIKYTSHGWPHFFYMHQLEDVIDKFPIDKWNFVPGSLFSYPISNYLFYLSLLFLFVVLAKILMKFCRTSLNNKILCAAIGILVLAIIGSGVFVFLNNNSAEKESDIQLTLPIGYTLDNYEIAEVSYNSCQKDSECITPREYAMRSNCPYVSLCLKNKCTVVCPSHIQTEL